MTADQRLALPTDWHSWRSIPPETALGEMVAPHLRIEEDDAALGGYLLGNGHIQLCNPGFEDHMVGIGTIPWFGHGHCALLAWHLHLQSGFDLVTLMPGKEAQVVHTAVRTPEGLILDWRGPQSPSEALEDYRGWLGTSGHDWHIQNAAAWSKEWTASRSLDSLSLDDGWLHPDRTYAEFEIKLADYLARLLLASTPGQV